MLTPPRPRPAAAGRKLRRRSTAHLAAEMFPVRLAPVAVTIYPLDGPDGAVAKAPAVGQFVGPARKSRGRSGLPQADQLVFSLGIAMGDNFRLRPTKATRLCRSKNRSYPNSRHPLNSGRHRPEFRGSPRSPCQSPPVAISRPARTGPPAATTLRSGPGSETVLGGTGHPGGLLKPPPARIALPANSVRLRGSPSTSICSFRCSFRLDQRPQTA